ncbi:hypothetical protein SNEBB_006421 [Seison nebaliae]|nr:hypothetical protein SNEBB_006421 [Seison nebaliae]
MNQMNNFQKWKENCLSSSDRSIRGEIDPPVRSICSMINRLNNFCTTSSCSGRICILAKQDLSQKTGTRTLYQTHEIDENIVERVREQLEIFKEFPEFSNSTIWLMVEPFVLHVSCSNSEHSKRMLTTALENGYKNSGIVPGKSRSTIAVRSPGMLNMILYSKSRKTFDNLSTVLHIATEQLEKNLNKLLKFQRNIEIFSVKESQEEVVVNRRFN